MIKIDKTDELYKYLVNLGVDEIDKVYLELAENGRYKLNDIRQYFQETFIPSSTSDVEEKDLEKILDYYVDLKKTKSISKTNLHKAIKDYKQTKDETLKQKIINSQLKDVLHQCLNYVTLHKNVDIQDVVQTANIGLLEALNKYNVNSKLDFKDYVIYWTRDKIKKEFEEDKNA